MPWLSLLKCKLCFKCLFNILRNVKFYKINKSRLFVTYFKLIDKRKYKTQGFIQFLVFNFVIYYKLKIKILLKKVRKTLIKSQETYLSLICDNPLLTYNLTITVNKIFLVLQVVYKV